MATEVRLPQFGMTKETAHVVKWLKLDGEYVRQGEPLVELLDDKAVIAFESPASGYLRVVSFENEEVSVDDLLADLLDSPNEPYPPCRPAYVQRREHSNETRKQGRRGNRRRQRYRRRDMQGTGN